MKVTKKLEQQIAVFGESGSGKTVLLSSLYGATQEPQFLKESLFHVVADDIGQGARLHKNYLGMRNSASLPDHNRFTSTTYSFSLKLKDGGGVNAKKADPFDALRIVWHDYPGEWFEQDVSGPEEAQRRVDTFRALLGCDVALLLVDSQRLLDNAGEEERYLKSLFSNYRNGFLSLRDDLLEDGKPLEEFPRIWILALSKSDLLPDVDVFQFRDLLIEKVCDDIEELRKTIGGLVDQSDLLSVGEDFMLLSSARFEPGKIELTERVGLDLILPLASILPFERHVRWANAKELPGKVAENLMKNVGPIAIALLWPQGKAIARLAFLMNFISPDLVDKAADLVGDKLKEMNAEALAEHQNLRATLTGFKLDLARGEEEHILLRSQQ